ncbi:hypothetical protein CUMW_217970 [Citrus unshiu]|uniref:Uncharacterized protein n=1 Tax=Citrus unshiu TaxID=55188 RepID=A0A2H5QCU9_CITUN|nr:hypothetical protein CUMW_217970 [Citrus unshiu]
MENIFVYNLKFGEDGRDEERGCQRFGFKHNFGAAYVDLYRLRIRLSARLEKVKTGMLEVVIAALGRPKGLVFVGDWLLGSSLESAALSGRLLPIILQIIYEVVEFVLRSLLLAYQQVFCHSKDMILGNSWVQMEKEEYLGKSWLGRKNEIQNDTSSTTDIWSCCSIHYC